MARIFFQRTRKPRVEVRFLRLRQIGICGIPARAERDILLRLFKARQIPDARSFCAIERRPYVGAAGAARHFAVAVKQVDARFGQQIVLGLRDAGRIAHAAALAGALRRTISRKGIDPLPEKPVNILFHISGPFQRNVTRMASPASSVRSSVLPA